MCRESRHRRYLTLNVDACAYGGGEGEREQVRHGSGALPREKGEGTAKGDADRAMGRPRTSMGGRAGAAARYWHILAGHREVAGRL